MPPKKTETVVVLEIPDQPPSFDNDAFMTAVLEKAKARDILAVEQDVAAALNTENYKTNLPKGVAVDFVVESILFASQHQFPPRKTAAFVRWMNDLRECIQKSGSVESAKQIFKEHLVSHAERSAKETAGGAGGSGADQDHLDSTVSGAGKSSPQAGGGAAATAAAKKDPKAKAGGKNASVMDESAAPKVDPNIFLTVGDVGAVADFVIPGLLQHWRLYHAVAAIPQVTHSGVDSTRFTLQIQAPMKAPALSRALTLEEHEAHKKDRERKADVELMEMRQKEQAELDAQRKAAEAAEAERLRQEEEERQNQLFFAHQSTEKTVEILQDEIHSDLAQRQQALIQRLAKLEEQLHLAS
jgi:hypothetical protein